MSLRIINIEKDTLPKNWIDLVKAFDIDNSNLTENNKTLAKVLKKYIGKFKEKSLISQDVKNLVYLILGKDDFFSNSFLDELDSGFITKVFDEIKNQEDYLFYLKIISLKMEIATIYKYINNGYIYKDIIFKDDNPDITLEKNNNIYELQVKHKQSIDDFLDSIQHYIEGMAMLEENSHLQNKSYYMNINQDSLNDSERKKAFIEVDDFIKNKDKILKGKYITIENDVTNNVQTEATNIDNNLCSEQMASDLIATSINRITAKLDKQYSHKQKSTIFIGVIIWSIPFHMKADFNLIEKIMRKYISLEYLLDVTLVPNLLAEEKTINFEIS